MREIQTEKLTPHRWAKARSVLLGEHKNKCSVYSAAREAGITIHELERWVARSRLQDPTDDPWVYEIAQVFDESSVAQAGTLEDVAWDHSINGTEEPVYQGGEMVGSKLKFDHRLLERLLKARDTKYIEKSASLHLNANVDIDLDMLQKKWEAMQRMKELHGDGFAVDARGSVITDDSQPVQKDLGLNDIAMQRAAERLQLIQDAEDVPDLDFEDL